MKTILITGSSSGIGRETARLYQSRGWNAIAAMRSPEREKELNTRDNVRITQAGCIRPSFPDQAVKADVSRLNQIDVLLNHAA